MLLAHGHPLPEFPYGCNAKSNNNFKGIGKSLKGKTEEKNISKKRRESLLSTGIYSLLGIILSGCVYIPGSLYIERQQLRQHEKHTSPSPNKITEVQKRKENTKWRVMSIIEYIK